MNITRRAFLLAVATAAGLASSTPLVDESPRHEQNERSLVWCPPNDVEYFFSGDVRVRKYGGDLNSQSCSAAETNEISQAIEEVMEDLLGNMGFNERDVSVCPIQRRRKLSLRSEKDNGLSSMSTDIGGNETDFGDMMARRDLRYYGGGFYFRHGGRCGTWCPTDNYDMRRELLPEHEDITPNEQQEEVAALENAKSNIEAPTDRRLNEVCTEDSTRVFYADFEHNSDYSGWKHGSNRKASTDGKLTNFLGPFYDGEDTGRMIYNIPGDADEVSLQFTFHEIDNWKSWKGDSLEVQIAGYSINLGTFSSNADEGYRSGYVGGAQITWSLKSLESPRNMGFGSAKDQRHRFAATFPRSYLNIPIKFIPHLSSNDASAGYDRVRVIATRTCRVTDSFGGFEGVAERRMEAELQLQLYQRFYGRSGHCMHTVLPRVDMDLTEESSLVQPNC